MTELVKRVFFLTARSKTFARFLRLLERVDDRRSNLLRVLTYHRVDEPDARPSLSPILLSATPAEFAEQMAFLAARYQVVSMAEVLDAFASRVPLPPRAVLLTFDDAYRDFAEHAWPILKRYRLPATLFVPTAFAENPTQPFWWDRLYHAVNSSRRSAPLQTPVGLLPLATASQRVQTHLRLRKWVLSLAPEEALTRVEQLGDLLEVAPPEASILGWEALRQLAREGVTLGAHTRTHPALDRVPLERARAEAVGSLRDLERGIGNALPILAYPRGAFSAAVAQMLAREGFQLAFTMSRGLIDVHTADRMRLHRLYVGPRTTLPVIRSQLLRWSIYLNQSTA